jgi:MOSC domain-containing protein YiiM
MAKVEDPEQCRRVKAICISREKGKKVRVREAGLEVGLGLRGDFHAGSARQISLLAEESVNKMREKGLKLKPGDFGENILTEGIELSALGVGAKLKIGNEITLEITEIGKVCPARCSIYYQVGDCIMPREGVFAKIVQGGEIKVGDEIQII